MDQIYTKYGILPIQKMIDLELCKLGFKLINNLLPMPLSRAFMADHREISTVKIHQYNTRNKGVPNLPNIKNTRYRRSFLFQAVSHYSKLPHELTNLRNLPLFVKKCKKHLQTAHP